MLCRLAWGNVRRAGRDYLVYLLTRTLAVTVFYAFNTLGIQVDYAGMRNWLKVLLGNAMFGLTVFLAVVMGFLMVYANNFIMRRRKKEFGLYLVLGMDRGQVARIMALETLMVSGLALVLGIALGVVLSQVMTFFTASLFKARVANFQFFFSTKALALTALCLLAIFLVTLVFNLRVVARAKIIDLVGAERENEAVRVRNPWISAALFLAGVVLTGLAYARLLRDGFPMTDSEMPGFGLTTALVVIGTVLLFYGLAGFLLKVLQAARGLYWRGLNMFTLRQLAAKVNTVSLSMAVIALVLFLAMTSVTGGMSLAGALNSTLEQSTPADYTRSLSYYAPSMIEETKAAAAQGGGDAGAIASLDAPVDLVAALRDTVKVGSLQKAADRADDPKLPELAKQAGAVEGAPFDLASIAGSTLQVDAYDTTLPETSGPSLTLGGIFKAAGKEIPGGNDGDAAALGLPVMTQSAYNAYLRFRGLKTIDLGGDRYLITCSAGASFSEGFDAFMAQGKKLGLGGFKLEPAAGACEKEAASFVNGGNGSSGFGIAIVPDRVVSELELKPITSFLLVDYRSGLTTAEGDAYVGSADAEAHMMRDAADREVGMWDAGETRTDMYESSTSLNGLISYLAVYIGFVLVVAAAAILAIQQLSDVADAGRSYRLLSELGCPTAQILRSVLTQQAVFFGFPLLVGVAHSLVALRVVIDVVRLFGGLSIGGMVWITFVIFAVCYGGYFLLTYTMSRSMVREAVRARKG